MYGIYNKIKSKNKVKKQILNLLIYLMEMEKIKNAKSNAGLRIFFFCIIMGKLYYYFVD